MMMLLPNNPTSSGSINSSNLPHLYQQQHHQQQQQPQQFQIPHQIQFQQPLAQQQQHQQQQQFQAQQLHHPLFPMQDFEFEGEQPLFDNEDDLSNFETPIQNVQEQTPSSILSLFEEKTRQLYSFSSPLYHRILFKRLRNRECNKQEANIELSQKYWDPSLDFPVVKGNRYRMLLLFDASRWSPQWNVSFPLRPKLFDAQQRPIDAGARVLNLARYKDKATSKEGFVLIECCVEFTVLSSRHKGPFTLQVSVDVSNRVPLVAVSSQFNIVSRVAPQRKRGRSPTVATVSDDDKSSAGTNGSAVSSPSSSSGSSSPISPRSAKRIRIEEYQTSLLMPEENPALPLPILPSSPLSSTFSLSNLLLCE